MDPDTSPDTETDPDIDTEEALSKARDELENARRQIKNLRQALAEAHRDAVRNTAPLLCLCLSGKMCGTAGDRGP